MEVAWKGLTAEMPEEYRGRPLPEGCGEYVTVYVNGNRTFHKGKKPTPERIKSIAVTLSRCWDSLSEERKQEINQMAM